MGFRESRPSRLDVGSPRMYARAAWLNSWTVMATSRAVPTVARNVENTMTNVPGLSSRRSNERNSIA